MTLARQRRIGTAILTAALALAPAAHADPEPPPNAPVPTPDQVAAILNQLTDPDVPDTDKAKLVDGGLSPVEMSQNDQGLA
jgi:hypothetical protein